MEIRLQANASGVELIDGDEFTSFAVAIAGIDEAQWHSDPRHRQHVTTHVGHVEDISGESHAWVPLDLIVSLADREAADSQWYDSLASMVRYANSRGWLRDYCVRAHVAFVGPGPADT
jgi:hypothetical protein